MSDKKQRLLREALQQIYQKGQEEGVSLNRLLAEAGEVLRPLLSNNQN